MDLLTGRFQPTYSLPNCPYIGSPHYIHRYIWGYKSNCEYFPSPMSLHVERKMLPRSAERPLPACRWHGRRGGSQWEAVPSSRGRYWSAGTGVQTSSCPEGLYIYIYIYVCIYVYMYVHLYIYIYI